MVSTIAFEEVIKLRRLLALTVAVILTIVLFTGIMGCGEDGEEKEPVRMIKTEPASGGEIPANAGLVITFDGT